MQAFIGSVRAWRRRLGADYFEDEPPEFEDEPEDELPGAIW